MYIYIYIYIFIYIYINIYIYRYTPGSCDPPSLPSMSSEQVCQASFPCIYIYIYTRIYIYTYQSSSKSSKPFLLSHNPGVHPLPSLAQIVTIKFVRLGPIKTHCSDSYLMQEPRLKTGSQHTIRLDVRILLAGQHHGLVSRPRASGPGW